VAAVVEHLVTQTAVAVQVVCALGVSRLTHQQITLLQLAAVGLAEEAKATTPCFQLLHPSQAELAVAETVQQLVMVVQVAVAVLTLLLALEQLGKVIMAVQVMQMELAVAVVVLGVLAVVAVVATRIQVAQVALDLLVL
jgi:hypothetical protein